MNNPLNNAVPMLNKMLAHAQKTAEIQASGHEAIEAVQNDFQKLDIGNVDVHRVTLQHNDSANTTTMDVVDAHKFGEVATYASKAGEMLCMSLNVNIGMNADNARFEQAFMAIEALLQIPENEDTLPAIQRVIDMTREANG